MFPSHERNYSDYLQSLQQENVAFCNHLIPLKLTVCNGYTSGVGAADTVLKNLQLAGIRPADLARQLDIDRSTASLMLAGKRGIPTWHLDKIAALMETSVPQLFEEREAVPRKGLSDTKKAEDVTSPVPGIGDKIGIPTASQPPSSVPTAPLDPVRGQALGSSTSVSSSRLQRQEAARVKRGLEIVRDLVRAKKAIDSALDALGGSGTAVQVGANQPGHGHGGTGVGKKRARRAGGGR